MATLPTPKVGTITTIPLGAFNVHTVCAFTALSVFSIPANTKVAFHPHGRCSSQASGVCSHFPNFAYIHRPACGNSSSLYVGCNPHPQITDGYSPKTKSRYSLLHTRRIQLRPTWWVHSPPTRCVYSACYQRLPKPPTRLGHQTLICLH